MMSKVRVSSLISTVLLMLLCLFLTACLGGGAKNTVRYYLVDPVPVETAEIDTERQLAIELIDLDIPQYLQRFQMVTRNGDNRLRFSDNNQWAENLRKNLLRTLAINLATRLSTIDI
ncbi:MAG: putative lipoprotein YmbA, partial [Gammaproteobacteria bacterium]